MMVEYRKNNAGSIGSSKLTKVTDYLTSESTNVLTGEKSAVEIEKTDAVEFAFDDGCWYSLRPSGTEPKIKLYIYTKADTAEKAEDKLTEIKTKVLEVLHSIK